VTTDPYEELEQLSERGTFWSPRDQGKQHPEKLVVQVERWESKPSKFNPERERPILVGRDRYGTLWMVPCDNLDLQPLYTGDVKAWNDEKKVFEVVGNWGRTAAGEVVAVEYAGDRNYTNREGQLVTTGSYRFMRKPPDNTGGTTGAIEQPPPIDDNESDGFASELAEEADADRGDFL
jgi:hypothetical protein